MKVVCGCCEPAAPTALKVYNRPALSAIAYRIGTYATFRQAMLQDIAHQPELAGLTTRRSDDYAITMLDLWAAVADILTFHQERYLNEAFLRTARFRDSVSRLAGLLDYRLRPGVAARTWIAFQLEPGSALIIPAGQKIQSVPEGNDAPQTFETTEEIASDARLNRLRVFPAPIAVEPLSLGQSVATLDRLEGPSQAASLAPGQSVVIFNDGSSAALEEKEIKALKLLDDRVELSWSQPIQRSNWTFANTKAFQFRRTFRVFGHNAPNTYMQPREDLPDHPGRIVWDLETTNFNLSAGSTIELDGHYENLSVGQRMLIAPTSGIKRLVAIDTIEQVNTSVGPLTASVTRVQVTPNHPGGDRREITVYELEGDEISFWKGGYDSSLSGNELYLPGVAVEDEARGIGIEVDRTIERDAFKPGHILYPIEIEKGRTVLVEDANADHVPLLATIKNAPTIEPAGATPGQFCHLVLEIEADRDVEHDADSAVVLGNVAAASHGESVRDEVLGSGDASTSFMRLPLGKKPLTYLPAATPTGAASTLELRINGVRWQEVPGLFGQPDDASVYELHHTDDGTTIVQFGDGVIGAPPPTGAGNIQATYRIGSGLVGRVPERSLTTLLAKPTGLAEATNPLSAEGGADPESLDGARENAPRTVRTFGRAVSLQDFEDLVTASGEVAKAHATWVWDGLDQAIHLTIAGQDGGQFSEDARRDLGRNLDAARDPNHRLLIDNFSMVFVRLRAGIGIDSDHDPDVVLAAVNAAIVESLSFDQQRLGQSLHLSDFYRLIQDVEGVVYGDIDVLHFKQPTGMSNPQFLSYILARGATFAPVQNHVRVFSARPDPMQTGRVFPAELAALESPTQDVTISVREA